MTQGAEERLSDRAGPLGPQLLFTVVKDISPVAREKFISSIAGKRNFDSSPCKPRKPVRGKGRTVSEWFIKNSWQSGDGLHIVALSRFDTLAQPVTRSHRSCVHRF